MSYERVLPRDAFNEAKLLKCLGRISLLILDGFADDFECKLLYYRDDNSFQVRQNSDDGSIYVTNFRLEYEGEEIRHFTPLNSKRNYPMQVEIHGECYFLFDEDGNLNKMFKEPKKNWIS